MRHGTKLIIHQPEDPVQLYTPINQLGKRYNGEINTPVV